MKLPEQIWQNAKDWHAHDVMAYYVAAIDEKEREGMPLIGPSVDRRMFQMLARVADSASVRSLACFACAQWRTYARVWASQGASEIVFRSADLLEKLEAREREPGAEKTFTRNFSLPFYIKHYSVPGNDRTRRTTPNFDDPRWQSNEWKRRFVFSNSSKPSVEIICCPEDVRRTSFCKHASGDLCPKCKIPLCQDRAKENQYRCQHPDF